jgi:segregation and condensation protein A
MYHVRLEQFEGPLPLLLSLIEKEKLDISRLALAMVAEQYLSHIAREREVSLPNLSSFLLIASRLILLKSQALLPILSLTDEETRDAEDLERQLREYRRYKEAALRLGTLFLLGSRSFRREPRQEATGPFVFPRGLSTEDIRDAFARVLENIPFSEEYQEVAIEETLTIEERMAFLESQIARNLEAAFSDIVNESNDRIEVIVSFLALLELIRRKTFEVEQGEIFGEIRFRRAEVFV